MKTREEMAEEYADKRYSRTETNSYNDDEDPSEYWHTTRDAFLAGLTAGEERCACGPWFKQEPSKDELLYGPQFRWKGRGYFLAADKGKLFLGCLDPKTHYAEWAEIREPKAEEGK